MHAEAGLRGLRAGLYVPYFSSARRSCIRLNKRELLHQRGALGFNAEGLCSGAVFPGDMCIALLNRTGVGNTYG